MPPRPGPCFIPGILVLAALSPHFVDFGPSPAGAATSEWLIPTPGLDPSSNFGDAVAVIGDLDGDGRGELVVGEADFRLAPGQDLIGRVAIYGSATSSMLMELRAPTGFFNFGLEIVSAGDFDDDGNDDLFVVARAPVGPTTSPVYLWSNPGVDPEPQLFALEIPGNESWRSYGGGRDVNGDGVVDLVVGSSLNQRVYVFFGGTSPSSQSAIELRDQITPEITNSGYGFSVATPGDVDGDGWADVIVGTPVLEGLAGRVDLYRGGPSFDDLPDGSIVGGGSHPSGIGLGYRLISTGDLDVDGYDDFIAVDPVARNAAGQQVGFAQVVHGGPGGALTEGLALWPPDDYQTMARDGVGLGDVNGDTYPDFVMGLWSGTLYLVYHGGPDMDAWPDDVFEAETLTGRQMAAAGDWNGDGLAELALGASIYGSLTLDCDGNGIPDAEEIANGELPDCDGNGIADGCDIWLLDGDCDANGQVDRCEIEADPSRDCDGDGRLDACEWSRYDCDDNGVLDSCEIAADPALDCNGNSRLDRCDLVTWPGWDCDGSGGIDSCELSVDPTLDCDGNGRVDACDFSDDPSLDCNENQHLDSCELGAQIPTLDCDGDAVLDVCQPLDPGGLRCASPFELSVSFDASSRQTDRSGPNVGQIFSVYVVLSAGPGAELSDLRGAEFNVDLPPGIIALSWTLELDDARDVAYGLDDEWVVEIDPPLPAGTQFAVVAKAQCLVTEWRENGPVQLGNPQTTVRSDDRSQAYWLDVAGSAQSFGSVRYGWINRSFDDCNQNDLDDTTDLELGYAYDLNTDGILDECQDPTAVPGASTKRTTLLGCRPNPFNPLTEVRFVLGEEGPVEIEVYDLRGSRVRRLMDRRLEAGSHGVQWDGRDELGREVASGVYFVRLRAGDTAQVRKAALVR